MLYNDSQKRNFLVLQFLVLTVLECAAEFYYVSRSSVLPAMELTLGGLNWVSYFLY